MILEISPITVLIVGLLISVLAPKWLAQWTYLGGLLWLYMAAATAVTDYGLRTQWFVLGQLAAWVIPGIIVAFRSVFEPEDRPHWTHTVAGGSVTGVCWLRDALTPIAGTDDASGPQTRHGQLQQSTDPQHQDHTLVPDEDRFTTTLEHEVDMIDDFRT